MDKPQWAEIVARLNASYPGQQVEPMTAREWYTELAHLPADRVWRAVRRLRRERSFRPSLAELLDACAAEARAEPSAQAALTAREDGPGEPMPADAADRLAAMGLRRVGRRVPADDRANQARLEAERRRQLARLTAMGAEEAR
jgi:hypothetical protein